MSSYLQCILKIADAIPGYSAEQLEADLQAKVEADRSVRTMTLQEAAKTLQMSLSGTYKWVYSGKLPVKRIGRKILVKVNDLEELINGRKKTN